MFESVPNGLPPRKAHFNILPLHWLIMERSHTWPEGQVTWWPDLGSPISKFQDIHFVDTVVNWIGMGCQLSYVSRCSVAMTSIQTFSEVRSHVMTWWPDLEWPDLGLKVSQHVRKKIMNRCAKNGGAPRQHGCVQRWAKNDWTLWPSYSQG